MREKDEPTTRRDRARGALLGLACGDALGTTLEFARPGAFEPIDDMVGGGPFRLGPGEWTDDTSMALCMAESLVDLGGIDLGDHHYRYLAWRDLGYFSSTGQCFDIGGTVGRHLRRFQKTGVPVLDTPDENEAANGSLMRLAPVPIAWHRDPATAAERSAESSRSTHPATRPVDACRLLGAMIASLVDGAPATEVFDPSFWRWAPLHPEIDAIAAGCYRDTGPPDIRGTGYCVDALRAALWAVHDAADFRDAVLRAANLGDDADTTAAITGQLAGARWGESAIPRSWRTKLAMGTRIASLADALYDLAPDDGARRPPEAEWRFASEVDARWAVPGVLLTGGHPWTVVGDDTGLDLLLDAGIRTVVDLTGTTDHVSAYDHRLRERATFRRLDVRYLQRPMEPHDDATLHRVITDITREADHGRPVYVHCDTGTPRAQEVAAAFVRT